jgi:hypothetical protein
VSSADRRLVRARWGGPLAAELGVESNVDEDCLVVDRRRDVGARRARPYDRVVGDTVAVDVGYPCSTQYSRPPSTTRTSGCP